MSLKNILIPYLFILFCIISVTDLFAKDEIKASYDTKSYEIKLDGMSLSILYTGKEDKIQKMLTLSTCKKERVQKHFNSLKEVFSRAKSVTKTESFQHLIKIELNQKSILTYRNTLLAKQVKGFPEKVLMLISIPEHECVKL